MITTNQSNVLNTINLDTDSQCALVHVVTVSNAIKSGSREFSSMYLHEELKQLFKRAKAYLRVNRVNESDFRKQVLRLIDY
ncbi:hypothetical protein ACFSJY_19205 [Thalassotalea euphylliae]